MDTILSVASRAVVDACAALGLDVDVLLREAGLERAALLDADARLPAERADALWLAAYRRADDPALALHAAEALPFGAYKVVDHLCAHSATVGDAFERIADFFAIVDPRAVLEVHGTSLVFRTRSGAELPPPAQEYTLAALVTRAARLTTSGWAPRGVDFTFEAPEDATEHRRVLRAPVRFARPCARVVFSAAAWGAPIVGAQGALLDVLEDHARRLLAELPTASDTAGRVRARLAHAMQRGEHDIDLARCAQGLAMSSRTLSRRLRDEGTTFGALRAATRLGLAKAHLADEDLSLAEIGWLVGFSDQTAFTRAFRRWTGVTPGAWRRSRRR